MIPTSLPSYSYLNTHAPSLLIQKASVGSDSVNSEPTETHSEAKQSTQQPSEQKDSETQPLSEQRELRQLKNIDRQVKAHELAHSSVGGKYASGASFTYQKGSDGVLYAVAGEVSIDTSEIANDPQATLQKAQIIQRAALAPADPSGQDRLVASAAGALAQKARSEIIALQEVENTSKQPSKSQIDIQA